jgi:hypothetical protein
MLCTPTFDKSYRVTEPATHPAWRTDGRLTATAIMPHIILEALREAFTAHRRYEHLRSEGVHHDLAIRQAFRIAPPASA